MIRLRLEVKHELVELDARLPRDDRDDTLVALDRRETRDLHRLDVANDDAMPLRLLDELVHRPGARAALVRDEESLNQTSGADRLEHRVRSGDRLPRLVRGRGLRARTRGDAADLLGVLRARARTRPAHAGHR